MLPMMSYKTRKTSTPLLFISITLIVLTEYTTAASARYKPSSYEEIRPVQFRPGRSRREAVAGDYHPDEITIAFTGIHAF